MQIIIKAAAKAYTGQSWVSIVLTHRKVVRDVVLDLDAERGKDSALAEMRKGRRSLAGSRYTTKYTVWETRHVVPRACRVNLNQCRLSKP